MDSPQIEKVVAFGGKIYNCLNEYDNGNKDAFNVIIDQLSDPLLDYKVLMKLLKEVRLKIKEVYVFPMAISPEFRRGSKESANGKTHPRCGLTSFKSFISTL